MPTVFEAAMLSRYVYNPNKHPLPIGWRVGLSSQRESHRDVTGYKGILFFNDEKNEAVIAHRGSKFRELPAGTYNATDDIEVFAQSIPFSLDAARRFAQLCLNELNESMQCTHVGHSLGGFHAHMVGYSTQLPVIAFDPLACSQHLQQIYSRVLNAEQLDQHHSYFLAQNIINTINTHVGHKYLHLADEDLSADTATLSGVVSSANRSGIAAAALEGVGRTVAKTVQTHKIESFIELLMSHTNTLGVPSNFSEELWNMRNHHLNEEKQPVSASQMSSGSQLLFVGGTEEEKVEEVKSKMKDDLKVTQILWVASLVNSGSSLEGHSVLVIEGVDDNGRFFANAYDIRARMHRPPVTASYFSLFKNWLNPKGVISKVGVYEPTHEARYRHFISSPHHSFHISRGEVTRIVDSIKVDERQTLAADGGEGEYLPYQMLGSRGGVLQAIFSSGQGMNCAEYLIRKFENRGIDIGTNPKPKKIAGYRSY